jgi:hypothetical protein
VAFPLRSSISVSKNHEKSKLPKIPTFAPDFAMTFDQRSSIKSAIRFGSFAPLASFAANSFTD